jgi:hypothetical protein
MGVGVFGEACGGDGLPSPSVLSLVEAMGSPLQGFLSTRLMKRPSNIGGLFGGFLYGDSKID